MTTFDPHGNSRGDPHRNPAPLNSVHPLNSFEPLTGANTRILVLGTMPGQASLDKCEYYAHPRNAFWPIALAHVLNAPISRSLFTDRTYETRSDLLVKSHIGLWDVLAQCERTGSLDSKIVKQSIIPNPINALLSAKPSIKAIIFNGKTAERLFMRHITLDTPVANYSLPSTSPAMASLSLEEKFISWNQVLTQYRNT